jgi:hypothetical protein
MSEPRGWVWKIRTNSDIGGRVFLAIWMSEIKKNSKTNFFFLYFELSILNTS